MLRRLFKKSARPQGRPQKARPLRIRQQRKAKRTPAEKRPRPGLKLLGRFLSRLAALAGLWLLVTAGLLGAYVALAAKPHFLVQRAEVVGTRHLSRWEVLRAAGVGAHSNLLTLNVGKVGARLRRLAWVEQASVQRILPHTILIKVKEHKPHMLALVEGELYYLDAGLKTFARLEGEPALDLPVLTGLRRADLLAPDEEIRGLLKAAGDLMTAWQEGLKLPGGTLSEVHLDRVWGLSLVLGDLPATVRLGFGKPLDRLPGLKLVVEDLKRRGELPRATLIDLDAGRRIVVRLSEESA